MANQQLGFDVVGKSNAAEVMGKAGKEADKLANKLKNAFDIKGALTGAFIGAFGAAALLDKAINTITESFKEMADIADQSEKAGISGAEFDKLSFAAKQAGVSTSMLSKGIRELRFTIKDAMTDTQKMQLLTKGLGFSEEEVRKGNVSQIDILMRLSRAIASQENDTTKLAIANVFLGDKLANDLLPILQQIGSDPHIFDGLNTASEELYKKADKLSEKWEKVWHNIKQVTTATVVRMFEHPETFLTGGMSGIGETKSDREIRMAETERLKKKYGYVDDKKPKEEDFGALVELANKAKGTAPKNTIAGDTGGSMGNTPTSGVIGVGNNAQFTLMESQLATLEQIRDAIDRLGTPQGMNTDFTKQELPTA
jgi:hypothetical protein